MGFSGPFPSYEISPNPPAVMSWEEYRRRSTAELHPLRNLDDACDAETIRNFLVRNPSWIPGAHGLAERSGHAPYYWAVVFQSPLREWSLAGDRYVNAETVKVPDFMWLAGDEERFGPVLIEVGTPMDVFLTEVARWRAWFSRPENRISFCADFGMTRAHKKLNPEFLLIGGHRGTSGCPDRVTVMSFEDLQPDRNSAPYICVTKPCSSFEAMSVSPLLRLGPASAVGLCHVVGLAEAIAKNDWISPERRQFLIERLPFWTEWPRMPKRLPERLSWDDWE